MTEISHLFIVGAGFSYNAGLPLAGDFTNALLNIKGLKLSGPSSCIVEYLRKFVDTTFGHDEGARPDDWPNLEDIFTLVDLSANTGHHLGARYSAADLRTVRRAMIVRVIRMLQQCYNRRRDDPDDNWVNADELLRRLDLNCTAVLSLNWDNVIERGLMRTQKVKSFDYGCGARPASFSDGEVILKSDDAEGKSFELLKPHGSINWLYCDACREPFWLPPGQTEQVAQTLFRKKDWLAVEEATGRRVKTTTLNPSCPICESHALGTRLATFSYRKALDFPMHALTWRRAEALLREADTWIFFGYSMPGADFEFKHLLKRVELSRRKRPNIVVITGGSDAGSTKKAYENFFGSGLSLRTYHCDGLTGEVLDDLAALGALRAPPQKRMLSRKKRRVSQ